LPKKSVIQATICEAARATSAASTFFAPVTIGNRSFCDGGLGANNPVQEVELEAKEIWCSDSADLQPLVKCFTSTGTGNPGIAGVENNFFKFLGKTMVRIATETEETERKFIANWRRLFDEDRYFRFNVDQGLQNVRLDEYTAEGDIEAKTDKYLDHQAQANRVQYCIQNLRLKKSVYNEDFS
jgi:predicted acylesterase/phospholipase RssA